MTPLVYRKRVERLPLDNKVYVPLNFGRYQLGLPILFTLCLEDHGSTFRRVDCSSTLWASPQSEDWQNEYELLGRRRICIQHGQRNPWKTIIDRSNYLVSFDVSGLPDRIRLLQAKPVWACSGPAPRKNRKLFTLGGPSQVMLVGYLVLASFKVTKPDMENPQSCTLWIATRRCAGTLTLEAWLSETDSDAGTVVSSFKDKAPLRAEKKDSVQLRCPFGGYIDIRLKPHVGPSAHPPIPMKPLIPFLVEVTYSAQPVWRSEGASLHSTDPTTNP
jgi:hypothetical protein